MSSVVSFVAVMDFTEAVAREVGRGTLFRWFIQDCTPQERLLCTRTPVHTVVAMKGRSVITYLIDTTTTTEQLQVLCRTLAPLLAQEPPLGLELLHRVLCLYRHPEAARHLMRLDVPVTPSLWELLHEKERRMIRELQRVMLAQKQAGLQGLQPQLPQAIQWYLLSFLYLFA